MGVLGFPVWAGWVVVWLVAGWRAPSDADAGLKVQDEGDGFGRVVRQVPAEVD